MGGNPRLSLVYRVFHTSSNFADLLEQARIDGGERIHLSVEERRISEPWVEYCLWRVKIRARYWFEKKKGVINKREVIARKRLEFGCPNHRIDLYIQLYREFIEEAGLKVGEVSYISDGDGL